MGEIKIFQGDDILEVLDLCVGNMEFDAITETLLREKIYDDPDYDPQLVLTFYERSQLVGFMLGVARKIRDEHIAYIKLMAVDKTFRRKGIARSMYLLLEQEFIKRGAEKIRIYDAPFNYFMPGIDPRYTPALAFGETLGFKRFADTSNMIVDLHQDFSTASEENELISKKIEIRRAEYNDRPEIIEFLREHFDLWQYEVLNAFNSLPVSLHIARCEGKIKAFSGHNGNNYGTGWFGPMGTHPDLRGKGIGSILLKRCLQDIKDWGLTKAIIPWVGPIRFYSYYVNAVVDRVFWRYEKILK